MKILHIITDLEIGGAEMMLYQLIKHSNRKDFNHSVVSLSNQGSIGDLIEELNVTIKALELTPSLSAFSGIPKLVNIIQREKPDIIHTWMYHANFLGGIAASLSKRLPIIWSIHHTDLDAKRDPLSTRIIVKTTALASFLIPATIVCSSQAATEFHRRIGYSKARLIVIRNGFDANRFLPDAAAGATLRSELGLDTKVLLIGMAARYHPQKDHKTFIEAANLFHARNPNAHFALCGEGIEWQNSQLSDRIGHYELTHRFHLLGNRQDMPRIYPAWDIANLASHGESFPLTIGEAMACGVPCVATDVGDLSIMIGDTGIIIPPENPKALAEGWSKLISLSPADRKLMGKAARERIQEMFSIERMVQDYETLYRKHAE